MNFSSDFYHILQLFCWLLSGYHTVSSGVFKRHCSSGSLPFSWKSSWHWPGQRVRLPERGSQELALVAASGPLTFSHLWPFWALALLLAQLDLPHLTDKLLEIPSCVFKHHKLMGIRTLAIAGYTRRTSRPRPRGCARLFLGAQQGAQEGAGQLESAATEQKGRRKERPNSVRSSHQMCLCTKPCP